MLEIGWYSPQNNLLGPHTKNAGVSEEFSRAQYSQSKSNPGLSGQDGMPAPFVDTMHALCDQPLWLYQEPFASKKEKKKKLVGVTNSTDKTNHEKIHVLNTDNFCILPKSVFRSIETLLERLCMSPIWISNLFTLSFWKVPTSLSEFYHKSWR